jgi:catechol 2,3-dioxygenase
LSEHANSAVVEVGQVRDQKQTAVLHHFGITVTTDDLDPMIEWYTKVLDLHINFRGTWGETTVCFMSNDDANHRVVFITNPALESDPTHPHARLGHTAYEYPTLDGLLAKYVELRDAEILPYLTIDHGLTISFYYMDPNRYGIELQVDAMGDWVKSTAWMRDSPAFAQNIMGVLVDPEALIAARRAGLSLDEIHTKGYDEGAYPPTPEQRERVSVMGVPLRNIFDHSSWPPDHPTFAGLPA